MNRRLVALLVSLGFLIPSFAFALEGTGPRVTITGSVETVSISEEQVSEEWGGQYTVRSQNGQLVNVVLDKYTKIISEGKLSRKELLPINIATGMQIRARGWRVNSDTITASLIVVLNLELNPSYALNGVIQSIDENSVTVLGQDGKSYTATVTNETEVNISYTLRGMEGLSLVGRQALLTLNPRDRTQVRIIRITGNKEINRR